VDIWQWTISGGFIFTLLNALLWCFITFFLIYNYYKNVNRLAFVLVLLALILSFIELLSMIFLLPVFMGERDYHVIPWGYYHIIQSLLMLTAALLSLVFYRNRKAGDKGSAES